MAMVLRRLIHDIESWRITIYGTDINPAFLKKARSGIYGDWSFRVTSPGLKEKFFKPHGGGKFELIDEIKSMVEFHQVNLVDQKNLTDTVPAGTIDVLFCHNVLMYFHPSQVDKILIQLRAGLDCRRNLSGQSDRAFVRAGKDV